MQTEIREAQVSDFEKIFSLIREFAVFIKTPEKVITSAERMKEDKDCFRCFVAEQNGEIVGFATWFFAYYSWSGKALYLDDLYVKEDSRGSGIGTLLFEKVIDTASENNCRKVRWQVSGWNKKAIAFYTSRGASVVDVEINCDLVL